MPRAGIAVAVSAGLVLLAAACSAPPPRPAPGAIARPDPRPAAAPLIDALNQRIGEHGSVRGTVTGDLGLLGELTAENSVNYRKPLADLSLTGHNQPRNQPKQRVEVVVVDGVGYLNSPMTRPQPDRPWLRIVPGGSDFASKLLSPAVGQLREAVDPRAAFADVEQATRIQSSGPDQVDGKPVTRYDLRVVAPGGERGYQLWVDEAGLPARFSATHNVAQAGRVSLTSTYRDWGTPTNIQAPPDNLVGAFPEGPPPQTERPPG
ncbi:hypothetical protein A8924_6784 [Saccharopolyspora erythraea NRRL 2338]|uniref:Uncharacterized protein n=2 Tax=Saccharopolyspora erythraea TaxID=1836 RepID=A4FNI2_SACEN|nr:hypothetical protein [Saccharopolyspora erythraea]EQD82142.1 hypothetical protein N599_32335 [Saccharopolyspora erythraea D]PFG99245.1 hypothetical protein A8924_6784 [Saccharopolyspora erythraea NRRL 2338]QRK89190.1 hypothetical protein JQX30_32220 [Saccharopolyspora erythraea]CAM05607.1 hypothetical protein SACE_6437 [Saccharopolyspora erythraea NRRL 2338]